MSMQNTADVMAALADQNIDTLANDKEIGEQDASDVLGTDADDDSATRIGSLVISTTGRGSTLQVPHAALEQKMRDLGFAEGSIPEPTQPRIAFTRAKNDLFSEYTDSMEFDGKEVEFDLWSEGRYKQYVVAEYMEDGEAETVTLGKIEFDPDVDAVFYHMKDAIKGTALAEAWGAGFVATMKERFAHYQTVKTADDIADLKRDLHRKVPHGIKLRRAVYFYPAITGGLDEVLESYRKLYSWLNDGYKLRGEATEFFWTPLFNREADKEFVSAKLEEHLEAEIESLVDDMADALADDETAEEIAEETLQPALAQMDSTVKEYEAISESTPRVKRMLKDAISDTDGAASVRAKRVLRAAENDE